MTDSEFLRLKRGDTVREGKETFTIVSLNVDNTDTLKRHSDGVCGKVSDERLKAMELIV